VKFHWEKKFKETGFPGGINPKGKDVWDIRGLDGFGREESKISEGTWCTEGRRSKEITRGVGVGSGGGEASKNPVGEIKPEGGE